jgi:predicted metalloendopeptidase
VAEKLDDEARAQVRKIIEDSAAAKAAAGTVEQKIGDYYASFMDTARIEAAGINALKADLDHIAAAKSASDLARLFGEPGFQSPVGVYIGPDDKNPDAYFVNLVQSGLGLPDRDYYLKDDPKLKEIRAANPRTSAACSRWPHAALPRPRIMALETKIAKAHWAAERTRDAIANYNPKGARQAPPGLDWQRCSTCGGGKWTCSTRRPR